LYINTHDDDGNEQPTWLQNSKDFTRARTDQGTTRQSSSTHETLVPKLSKASAHADREDQDYLLDLGWNSGQDEELSEEPDDGRLPGEDDSLLVHRSMSSLANSEIAEGNHAAPDWIIDLDLDMDSDTEIMNVMDNQDKPGIHVYLPFGGHHSVPGSSPDVESLSVCEFDILSDEHEAGSSTRSGSQDN
jgi:hypothetical protein